MSGIQSVTLGTQVEFGSSSSSSGGGRGLSTLISLGAGLVPGGGALGLIAEGASALLSDGADSRQQQLDQMWEMQREGQLFNLQYMELQMAVQDENRHFTTLSNLLKARHDTARAAINNIHV